MGTALLRSHGSGSSWYPTSIGWSELRGTNAEREIEPRALVLVRDRNRQLEVASLAKSPYEFLAELCRNANRFVGQGRRESQHEPLGLIERLTGLESMKVHKLPFGNLGLAGEGSADVEAELAADLAARRDWARSFKG